jgi:Zn-finger nucleic acid-binding protein
MMIVACSACDTRFQAAGYRDVHCPACGAMATQAATRPCPRCELPLAARSISDLVIDECSKCGGVFVDHVAVDLVLADHQHERAAALVDGLRRAAHSPLPPSGGRMYVHCPTCKTVMNRKLSASGSGVVVDVCKAHGTFFDAGELPAIIAFVQSGGMARSRQQVQREARAKEDSAKSSQSSSDSGFGIGDAAEAVVTLFFAIFE